MKKGNTKFLKDYEGDMITSLFHSYVRQLPTSTLMQIEEIYTEETGNSIKMNYYCSDCILKLMKQIGVVYFKDHMDRLDPDLQVKFKEKYKV